VIAAAGSGERLGAGGPKAFVELAGRPMLGWSLLAFDEAQSVAQIVIASPPGMEERVEEVAGDTGVEVRVVEGGEHRSQSVANALIQADEELVVVHDAARPLVTPDLIEKIVARLAADEEMAGVVAAAPVTDTIKEASISRRVIKTPERSRLWAVQTPQAFRTGALRSALSEHSGELAGATDDSMLVERAGGDVLLHEAPAENLKVTAPLDMTVAGLILDSRGAGRSE
jgi:2-C-methyl-D-erythritol 4-phosphate cytidylyltransferase